MCGLIGDIMFWSFHVNTSHLSELLQSEIWADARGAFCSRTELGRSMHDKDVRDAASQVSQHLPVMVVSMMRKDQPACFLVNIAEMVLYPDTLTSLLSLGEAEIKRPEPATDVVFLSLNSNSQAKHTAPDLSPNAGMLSSQPLMFATDLVFLLIMLIPLSL